MVKTVYCFYMGVCYVNVEHKRFHDVCPSGFSPAVTTVLLALCAVEAILFFLFTLIMFCTQISNVMEDSTVSFQTYNMSHQALLRM